MFVQPNKLSAEPHSWSCSVLSCFCHVLFCLVLLCSRPLRRSVLHLCTVQVIEILTEHKAEAAALGIDADMLLTGSLSVRRDLSGKSCADLSVSHAMSPCAVFIVLYRYEQPETLTCPLHRYRVTKTLLARQMMCTGNACFGVHAMLCVYRPHSRLGANTKIVLTVTAHAAYHAHKQNATQ